MANVTEHDRTYRTKEDICAHVGDDYGDFMGAIVPPVFQNSLFVMPAPGGGGGASAGGKDAGGKDTGNKDAGSKGYSYTRTSNPTTDIAERKIAALEGAEAGLCFSSGMAAISAGILRFAKKDCHIVMVGTAYGPTRDFITRYLADKFGVAHTAVAGDTDEIVAAARPDTALIYLESPSSLVYRIQDLAAVADFARGRGIATAIDNSYATPLCQNPLAYGIDLVCHTASKYLGGHSDIVAGTLAGSAELIESIRANERSLMGACMDPHQAWLLIRGIRTLPVRLRQHAENAMKVATFLEGHPRVRRVLYPGLDSFPQRELAKKYLAGGNGLMSFVPDGEPEQIFAMIGALKHFQYGVSWGGFESLVAGVSVGKPEGEAAALGLPANLVRIHVGLESADTLIADLDQALARCAG
ncbi:MAG: PLP-dependent aspartate aminotransferase family protein [Clostridiales bacterium]|nr:PLP-dependent aspartate aminotransferase family protein [Clostridiales bacterium]